MSENLLTAAARLLEKVTLGASDCEFHRLVDALKEAPTGENDAARFEDFRVQVNAIRQLLKDNALSERGLNFLIDTT